MLKLVLAAALIWFLWRWLKPTPRATRTLVGGASEARAILGVEAGADAAAIRAAHRRLVLGVHPDRGGSADLTRRVNAARDLLLRGSGRG
ncbi:MAG: DnaJ domain-containing protein [Janthinobacterium lividum]